MHMCNFPVVPGIAEQPVRNFLRMMSMKLPAFLTRDKHGLILLRGHRVGLHDILHFYREGYSPEMLLGEFPSLSLALFHKVIAFYLDHQGPVDRYLDEERLAMEQIRQKGSGSPSLAALRARMAAMQRAETS